MSNLYFAGLPDDLEVVYHEAKTVLQAAGITRLSPLSAFYVLLKTPQLARQFQEVTSLNPEEISRQVLEKIRENPGTGRFVASADVQDHIDNIEYLADGYNKAGVGHFLLAAYDMPQSDLARFLRSLGLDEAKIRENVAKVGRGLPAIVEQLTIDGADYFARMQGPILEPAGFKTSLTHIVACLHRMQGNNAIVSGKRGVGRHTMVRKVVRDILDGKYPRLKGYSVRVLDLENLPRTANTPERVIQLAREMPERTVLVVTEIRASEVSLVKSLFRSKAPVLGITTSSEQETLARELTGFAEVYEVKEPTPADTLAIVRRHVANLELHHGANASDLDEQTLELLIKNGPAITRQAMPGAAISLADLVFSQDVVNGDGKVTRDDVAEVIWLRTGVPTEVLTQSEAERLTRLPEILESRVIGQDAAKSAVKRVLRRAGTHLRDKRRPIGVFAFLGPTGVGKTETAKALAEFLFNDDSALIRIDMTEYREPHSVSRLIGAPPGYVGYDEGGQLTNAVRRQPYSVILFDEIDKAHPGVWDLLLTLMDEGRLTDGQGNTVDARHTILIMTSNHGSSLTYQALEQGHSQESVSTQTLEWFRRAVKPEFLNRFDDIIVFESITPEAARKILELQFNRRVVVPMKAQYNAEVQATEAALAHLLSKGYDPGLGARPLNRVIETQVLDRAIEQLDLNSVGRKKLVVDLENGSITVRTEG